MRGFKEMVSKMGLVDLGIERGEFTWNNRRRCSNVLGHS